MTYQYYWYFTYLSVKIIRNIEKSEYDVTVTSSLGVASQNCLWSFFVRRWSLCVNFMTLALLFLEIQRGQSITDWPKKSGLNRGKSLGNLNELRVHKHVMKGLCTFTWQLYREYRYQLWKKLPREIEWMLQHDFIGSPEESKNCFADCGSAEANYRIQIAFDHVKLY